jgi:hypothetical protein
VARTPSLGLEYAGSDDQPQAHNLGLADWLGFEGVAVHDRCGSDLRLHPEVGSADSYLSAGDGFRFLGPNPVEAGESTTVESGPEGGDS